MKQRLFLLLFTTILFISACGGSNQQSSSDDNENTPACVSSSVDNSSSSWSFDTTGNPTALSINGIDMFNASSSGGFYLVPDSGDDLHLNFAEITDDTLKVSPAQGELPRFTFRIDRYQHHLSIHLINIEPENNLDEFRDDTLEFRFKTNTALGSFALSDLAFVGGSSTSIEFRWYNLWAALSNGELGSVALYNNDEELENSAIDDALTSIWMYEDLPIPAGQSCWNEESIQEWVESYQSKFANFSEVRLEADSLDELYQLTDDIAIAHNVSRVYLHTPTWKFEYWPNNYSRTQVNTNVFPEGEADLIAYKEYLEQHNIMLHLHALAPGIGLNDPDYVSGEVDRRVLSWGSGSLVEGISSSDTSILMRVAEGQLQPEQVRDKTELTSNIHVDWIRIGEEIIECSNWDFEYAENTWLLSGCNRAYGANAAMPYSAGEEVVGLYSAWGRNLMASYDLDQENSLMQELIDEYGAFIERIGLDHIHFDGPQILSAQPGSIRDFQDRIYEYVSRPATSSSVGSSIDANFEQQFTALRDDLIYNYFPLEVGFRDDESSSNYPATSWLHTQYGVQESLALNARMVFLNVPKNANGVSQARLASHGLSEQVLDLFDDWLLLAPVFAEEDADYVWSYTSRRSGSNRYESEYILVLDKNSDGLYTFTPRHIMGRTSGEDDLNYVKQEYGAILRQQLEVTGTQLILNNPLEAQTLSFMLSVDHEQEYSLVNPTISIEGGATMQVTGEIAPGQYLLYEAEQASLTLYDNNWNKIEDLSFATDSNFTVESGENTISVENSEANSVLIETAFIVDGEEYILKTNDNL